MLVFLLLYDIVCDASGLYSAREENECHAPVLPVQIPIQPELGILLQGTAGGVVEDGEPFPRQIQRDPSLPGGLLQIAAAGGADAPALAGGAVAVDQLHQGRVHLPRRLQLSLQPTQCLIHRGSPLLQIQLPYPFHRQPSRKYMIPQCTRFSRLLQERGGSTCKSRRDGV